MSAALEVQDLTKSYGDVEAVRGISFTVEAGEVFGLLGPNGAGKTTTVEILEGIRTRTGGSVRVLGYDPGVETIALKQNIGVALQATNLPDKIKVREALGLFASFYRRTVAADGLLERLQLIEKRDAFYGTLSGGQKQRVAIALALINDPQLVFFDEPTTGLDPQVRLEIHGLIQHLRDSRRTILLTTHYIEEAERLCDRVAIVDQGRVIAIGSPRELQQRTQAASRIELRTVQALTAEPLLGPKDRLQISEDRRGIVAHSPQPARTLVELVKWIESQGAELEDVHLKRPTLEDVFLELTGRRLRD